MNAPCRLVADYDLLDPDDPGHASRIEAFVAGHPEGTPFHRPAWLGAVARGSGNRALVLAAMRGGALTAMLPLVEVRSRLFGPALVSSGFGVGGGVLTIHPDEGASLFALAEEQAVRLGCPTIELRGGPLPVGRKGWTLRSDSHCGYTGDLAADDEAQLLQVPRKQRAELRKGLSADLAVSIGSGPRDRAAHYTVYAESVRNLGTPVFPKRLFAEVLDAFGDQADILTVWHQGSPVASVLSLYHGAAVMPYWGGRDCGSAGLAGE